ncbi:hypothetical protein B0J11DRAFT_290157 [Dendryphion nanum]|uniref:Uncharacterized protein n=1 Tax=Dendryphion nanum TaxID=256645 RepID=A0A9P9DWZ8_9PLEO|nr:hypothetical protein B0J11DRAFT_290157 [Dendryphion nanum]
MSELGTQRKVGDSLRAAGCSAWLRCLGEVYEWQTGSPQNAPTDCIRIGLTQITRAMKRPQREDASVFPSHPCHISDPCTAQGRPTLTTARPSSPLLFLKLGLPQLTAWAMPCAGLPSSLHHRQKVRRLTDIFAFWQSNPTYINLSPPNRHQHLVSSNSNIQPTQIPLLYCLQYYSQDPSQALESCYQPYYYSIVLLLLPTYQFHHLRHQRHQPSPQTTTQPIQWPSSATRPTWQHRTFLPARDPHPLVLFLRFLRNKRYRLPTYQPTYAYQPLTLQYLSLFRTATDFLAQFFRIDIHPDIFYHPSLHGLPTTFP